MSDFYNDYVARNEDLLKFYQSAPDALFENAPVSGPWRPELVSGIKAFQSERGGGAAFKGDEAVVITGQQPGIFTGPLYTIYKAATTIRLAQKLQDTFDTPVIPVFWIGSEDHDFDEARTTSFLTKQHEPLDVTYTPDQPVDSLPMYRVKLEPSLHDLIDQASSSTNGSEFRQEITDLLHQTLDDSDSLADWTARLLIRLFQDTPLVFFAPHLAAGRRLAAEIVSKEIDDPLATTALLNEAGEALQRLGYTPQVVKRENECCFFIENDGCRHKLLFEKKHFVLPDTDQRLTPDEMHALLQDNPERFSPNVALRCIVQQHLFPAAAYVAGPSELAYWAQLKGVFERFALPMPTVYPRAQCTLTNIKLNKLRKKLDLSLADLNQREDQILENSMRSGDENQSHAFARDQRKTIETTLDYLVRGLQDKTPTAAAMAKSLHDVVNEKLDRIERSILHNDAAKTEATQNQIRRLCNSLAPNRKPQERVFNVFSFLFEQGYALVPRIIESIDIESFQQTEVEL